MLVRPVGAALLSAGVISFAATAADTVHPLVRGSAVLAFLAVVALTLRQPGSRPWWLWTTVPVACAGSLWVTFRYQGPADNETAQWILAETLALLVLAIPSVRHPRPGRAATVAFGLFLTIGLIPLRISLTLNPPAEHREAVGLCVIWGIAAGLSIGAACYLRSLDSRRRLAVAAERRTQRLTVARDLHDFAAHDVTGVMVLAQAAKALAKDSPERALALLPQIETAGVQALKSMDRTIRIFSELDGGREGDRGSGSERVLLETRTAGEGRASVPEAPAAAERAEHTGPRPSLRVEEVATLVDRFSRTGTIPARLDLAPGALDGLPPRISSVGYRVVMEGLTNVRRHAASASQVVVDVRHTDDGNGLRISVTDDGHGRPHGVAAVEREGGGTGIADLGRRIEAVGGTFLAEARQPVGWRVTAVLPFR
jgi:signal transduction histidine kinase